MNEGIYTNKCGEGKVNVYDICEAYEESRYKVYSSHLKICYDFSLIIFLKKMNEKNWKKLYKSNKKNKKIGQKKRRR